MKGSVQDVISAKARLNDNGRIVIPAAIRKEMGIAPGDTLLMDVEDGVLRIESYPARIRRISGRSPRSPNLGFWPRTN